MTDNIMQNKPKKLISMTRGYSLFHPGAGSWRERLFSTENLSGITVG